MPWHERWFYLDWFNDEAAESEADEAQQAFAAGGFDPRKPQTGDLATFDFGALGASHTVI